MRSAIEAPTDPSRRYPGDPPRPVGSSLDKLFDQLQAFRRPPVDRWDPQSTVDFDLVITADGRWIHEGDPVVRHDLVKLFSTVLVCHHGGYYLVTPGTKYRIKVEDTPFLAVEMTWKAGEGQGRFWFRTNVDEVVALDELHPLKARIDPGTGNPSPVIHVRDGLEARLVRSVYYDLAGHAVERPVGSNQYGVWSSGRFFDLT